ncbi:AMP-binding protein [Rhodococcus ruber]|uniref:AMP-binding protein n=1 Tax=Rhodococcus ruber TaxID=1830 RepID=A0ABT4MEP3_9NOCA|nr:AMP-binding protein [Rhodococcus ruber]MCZ4519458.1 AMP-binding protein [Rhodococcus ruber]
MDNSDVLPQLLARRAREAPDKIFALEPDGETATRAQMNVKALKWAGVLRDLGVDAGDTVLMMVPTSVEAVSAWIGIGWLRAIETPINTQYRGEMLSYALEDSHAKVMITHKQYLEQIGDVIEHCPRVETVIVLGTDGATTKLSGIAVHSAETLLNDAVPLAETELIPPTRDDIAAIIYTSGTTGPSKGVMVPWGQLYTMAHWAPLHRDVGAEDRIYAPFPFFHTTIKSPVYAMAQAGGSVLIHEKFSSKTYWQNVRAYDCTVGLLLGGMGRVLSLIPESPGDSDTPMKLVVMVPPIVDVHDFERRFGLRAGTIFGMSEVSTPLLTLDWNITDPASCGQPRPGCEVKIIDPDGNQVDPGVIGELIVRSENSWEMNKGYWNKPEATKAAWSDGWFHTGDAFRRDEDNNYFYVDRFKDAIRRRGENISSVEVENVVSTHPGVEMVAALGVPAEHGDEDVKIVVKRLPGSDFDAQSLIDYLTPKLPRFMVPRYVEFVDEMPMTVTQKIRKVDLRKQGVTADTWDREQAETTAVR